MENSAINMYFQKDATRLMDSTRRFWRHIIPNFDVYISEVVLDEIGATEELNLRQEMERIVKDFKVLPVTQEIVRISQSFASWRCLASCFREYRADEFFSNMESQTSL